MSRQRLSPSLGESSHHVCPRCSGTGTVRDNESLSLSILRLIEEEALKENTKEVHAIVPVPIASYLLNEKRAAVSAIEARLGGVRCVIVPNDQMQTPHYSVLRVRKGEETSTLSYMLPKLHEEAMALPSEEEYSERKLPEQPALAAFVMPEAPPAPAQETVAAKPATKPAAEVSQPAAQPGLLSRFLNALKKMFAGEEPQPAPAPVEKKEEKQERSPDRRKRQNNRRDRNERRDNRSENNEGREGSESRDNRDNREGRERREGRDENRRNRREKPQQNAEEREIRQPVSEESDKGRQRDEQQPRRERNRRRNDDKRQAQQEVKALNRDEETAQDTEQEERVQVMPRRKQRQMSQKVRFHSQAEEAAVEAIAPQAEPAQRTELAKVDLPAVIENAPEQEENAEGRENAGMPRRSRRSPRHLRVSGQRRRRYRDERYPLQSPMPLAIACASPEMASGKAWIRYPVARPQEPQFEEQNVAQETATPVTPVAVEAIADAAAVVIPEPQVVEIETSHPEVIAAPVTEQPQIVTPDDAVVAKQIAEDAAVAEPAVEEAAAVESAETTEAAVEPQPVVEVEVETEVQPEIEIDVEPVEAAEVEPEVTDVAHVDEPEVKPVPAVKPAPAAQVHAEAHHATAPMTRAPAPEYVPEAPRQSDWVRPAFEFDGKGSAGGHSATHHATAPAARPQPAE